MDDFALENNADAFIDSAKLGIKGTERKILREAVKRAILFGVEQGEKTAKENIQKALGL